MDTKKLGKWFRALELVRTEVGAMPVQQMSVFTYIAMNPGCSTPELEKALGMNQVSVGRATRKLGELVVKNSRDEKVKTGYGLVVTTPDPEDPRRHIFHLTNKGERVIGLVSGALE